MTRNVIHGDNLSPVPKQTRPRMVPMNFRAPASMRDEVVKFCQEDEVNVSDLMRDLLGEWLEKRRAEG